MKFLELLKDAWLAYRVGYLVGLRQLFDCITRITWKSPFFCQPAKY